MVSRCECLNRVMVREKSWNRFCHQTCPFVRFFQIISIRVEMLVVVVKKLFGLTLENFWLEPFVGKCPQSHKAVPLFHTHLVLMGICICLRLFQSLNVGGEIRKWGEPQSPCPGCFVNRIGQVLLQSIRPLVKDHRSAHDALVLGSLLRILSGECKTYCFIDLFPEGFYKLHSALKLCRRDRWKYNNL